MVVLTPCNCIQANAVTYPKLWKVEVPIQEDMLSVCAKIELMGGIAAKEVNLSQTNKKVRVLKVGHSYDSTMIQVYFKYI